MQRPAIAGLWNVQVKSSKGEAAWQLIVRQADRGPITPKPPGVATPPEVLEACGLDVGHFYELLRWLVEHELVQVAGEYPFEEIRLTPAAAAEFGGPSPLV